MRSRTTLAGLGLALACVACGAPSTTPIGNVHTSSGCIPPEVEEAVPSQATADTVTICFGERCFVRWLHEERVEVATAPPHRDPPAPEERCVNGRCALDVDDRRRLALYRDGNDLEVRDFDDKLVAHFTPGTEASSARFTGGAILVTFSAAGPLMGSVFHALDGTLLGSVGAGTDEPLNLYTATPRPVPLPGGRVAFFGNMATEPRKFVAIYDRGRFVKAVEVREPEPRATTDDAAGLDGMTALPDGRLVIAWGGPRAGALTVIDVATGTSTLRAAMRCSAGSQRGVERGRER